MNGLGSCGSAMAAPGAGGLAYSPGVGRVGLRLRGGSLLDGLLAGVGGEHGTDGNRDGQHDRRRRQDGPALAEHGTGSSHDFYPS